ncbi:MAG: TonB family protein [Pyrinomonadaceae bacterium MAG19_C2-C3]|nr:TonB family protein [Pyrinomonadaceae bacterium MAG19_C2-C3]
MIVAACLNSQAQVQAQSSTARDKGISLFKQGDTKEAIKELRRAVKDDKSDAVAWHHLGLALAQKGDKSGARKAFDKAFNLFFETALKDLYAPAETTAEQLSEVNKRRSDRIAAAFQATLDSFDQLVSINPKVQEKYHFQRDDVLWIAQDFRQGGNSVGVVYRPEEVDKKAVITFRPEPMYTDEARSNGVQGKVAMRVILAADGTIRLPVVVKSLSHGLTEQAIRAALKIKFKPAQKNERAVSTVANIAFSFNVY